MYIKLKSAGRLISYMKFPRFTPRLLQAVLGIVLAGFSVFPDVHARQPELLIINDYIDFIPRGHDPLDFDASGNLSGDYIKLLFVDSVAARGNDIFVADTTQRKIFRIDSIQRTISEFATLGPGIGTDLYVSDAFSLFVIDNQAGRVIEYFRDGRKIREFGNKNNARPKKKYAINVGQSHTPLQRC